MPEDPDPRTPDPRAPDPRTPDPATADHLERVSARMDAEVRAEQAAYEAMALQAERRARSLADVVRELVVRGDRLEICLGREVLTGTAVHAGRDYAVIRAPRGDVDVHLVAMTSLRVVERSRSGGHPPGRGATTFRARLTEHETAGTALTVRLTDEQVIEGTVAAAAEDHLLIASRRGEVVAPWTSVQAVWPRPTR